ncbi:MAG TPA: hypothetical protein VF535_06910 [Allosphingosinicella sp.]
MPNGRKRVRGTLAASILLTASLAGAPAFAKKPPPPPPPPPPGDWEGCTPYGSYTYDANCCDYPELIIPCESPASDPVIRPEEGAADSAEQ